MMHYKPMDFFGIPCFPSKRSAIPLPDVASSADPDPFQIIPKPGYLMLDNDTTHLNVCRIIKRSRTYSTASPSIASNTFQRKRPRMYIGHLDGSIGASNPRSKSKVHVGAAPYQAPDAAYNELLIGHHVSASEAIKFTDINTAHGFKFHSSPPELDNYVL